MPLRLPIENFKEAGATLFYHDDTEGVVLSTLNFEPLTGRPMV